MSEPPPRREHFCDRCRVYLGTARRAAAVCPACRRLEPVLAALARIEARLAYLEGVTVR